MQQRCSLASQAWRSCCVGQLCSSTPLFARGVGEITIGWLSARHVNPKAVKSVRKSDHVVAKICAMSVGRRT